MGLITGARRSSGLWLKASSSNAIQDVYRCNGVTIA